MPSSAITDRGSVCLTSAAMEAQLGAATKPSLLSSTGSLICFSCSEPFDDIDESHVPLLLPCGHSVCSRCSPRSCPFQCGCTLSTNPAHKWPVNAALINTIKMLKRLGVQFHPAESQMCDECKHQEACVFCANCNAAMCVGCNNRLHKNSKILQSHRRVPVSQRPTNTSTCSEHAGQPQILFCLTDSKPVCLQCLHLSHKGHSLRAVKDEAAEIKGELQKQLADSQSVLASLVSHRTANAHAVDDACQNGDRTRQTINEAVEAITAAVRMRGSELLKEVQLCVDSVRMQAAQRQEWLAVCYSEADAVIAELTQALEAHEDIAVLGLKEPVKQHVATVKSSVQEVLSTRPISTDVPLFLPTNELIAAVGAFGSVGVPADTMVAMHDIHMHSSLKLRPEDKQAEKLAEKTEEMKEEFVLVRKEEKKEKKKEEKKGQHKGEQRGQNQQQQQNESLQQAEQVKKPRKTKKQRKAEQKARQSQQQREKTARKEAAKRKKAAQTPVYSGSERARYIQR